MRFIDHRALARHLCLAALVALAACSSGPAPQPAEAPGQSAESSAPIQLASILPPGPVTPNPYLRDSPRIGAAVREDFEQAANAMAAKRWPQAEQLLTRLSREQPRYSGIWLNLGLVYRATGETAKAEAAFRQALTVNRNNLDACNQLAILRREAGDFAGAEQLYRQALDIWPFHADSHRNLGILYDLYLGREAEALQHYEAYKSLTEGEDRELDSWIADLQRRLNTGQRGG